MHKGQSHGTSSMGLYEYSSIPGKATTVIWAICLCVVRISLVNSAPARFSLSKSHSK